ncbi:MAG: helix-turn-helix transcriptional regulator [Hyphomonas sp.]|uniref:helix-turn-helix domain-containing protein n=1 Tax=Hyphomonas sp. TaxID=87 RepID=UPI003265FB3E
MPHAPSPHDARKPSDADRFIGRRVRQARRELGMTQEGLAENLSLTFQQVQKYVSGRSRLSAGRLREVAVALGKPVGYFYEPFPVPPAVQDADHAKLRVLKRDAKKLVDSLASIEDLKVAIHVLTALGSPPP